MIVDKVGHLQVHPVPRVERVAHVRQEPTDEELALKAQDWPVVYQKVVVENFYDTKGKLLSASTINLSTYG